MFDAGFEFSSVFAAAAAAGLSPAALILASVGGIGAALALWRNLALARAACSADGCPLRAAAKRPEKAAPTRSEPIDAVAAPALNEAHAWRDAA
ncbi:MAG: hypothetical protein AAGM38_02160 [Pseudomonadota bacterium]